MVPNSETPPSDEGSWETDRVCARPTLMLIIIDMRAPSVLLCSAAIVLGTVYVLAHTVLFAIYFPTGRARARAWKMVSLLVLLLLAFCSHPPEGALNRSDLPSIAGGKKTKTVQSILRPFGCTCRYCKIHHRNKGICILLRMIYACNCATGPAIDAPGIA